MKQNNYKTFQEIINDTPDKIRYSRVAEQLASLALTEFMTKNAEKGATITACSPKKIKTNLDQTTIVIGRYVEYTYDFEMFYYFQFEDNPFFTPTCYKIDKNGYMSSIISLHTIFDKVNEYSIEPNNVKQLIKNLFAAEKMLRTEVFCTNRKPLKKKDTSQRIYYI